MKQFGLAMMLGACLMAGNTIPAFADAYNDGGRETSIIGEVQNQPMLQNANSSTMSTRSATFSAVKIYGWPQIDSIHAPNSKYVSVHGWWTTNRSDLAKTKAKVTSILMIKKWYGYSHIGTSNTSSATRSILPNQTSKRSNARADCKNKASNTFWAMTILSGNGVIQEGTKSNSPVTLKCTPK